VIRLKKPRQTQRYLLRQKVKSAVKAKLEKRGKVKARQRQTVLKPPQTLPAVAAPADLKLPPGFKAKLHYDNGNVKVAADIRYETEKTEPLVKVKHIGPNNEIVHREFVGPSKVENWFDENGNEIDKKDVRTAQVMPDGSLTPVEITKTKDIQVEAEDADVEKDFPPYSFLEVWGEGEGDTDGLRKIGADLMKQGKVGAIREFSHGYGKMYVGFLRPLMSKDGKSF